MKNIWFDDEEYRRLVKKYENNINIRLLNVDPTRIGGLCYLDICMKAVLQDGAELQNIDKSYRNRYLCLAAVMRCKEQGYSLNDCLKDVPEKFKDECATIYGLNLPGKASEKIYKIIEQDNNRYLKRDEAIDNIYKHLENMAIVNRSNVDIECYKAKIEGHKKDISQLRTALIDLKIEVDKKDKFLYSLDLERVKDQSTISELEKKCGKDIFLFDRNNKKYFSLRSYFEFRHELDDDKKNINKHQTWINNKNYFISKYEEEIEKIKLEESYESARETEEKYYESLYFLSKGKVSEIDIISLTNLNENGLIDIPTVAHSSVKKRNIRGKDNFSNLYIECFVFDLECGKIIPENLHNFDKVRKIENIYVANDDKYRNSFCYKLSKSEQEYEYNQRKAKKLEDQKNKQAVIEDKEESNTAQNKKVEETENSKTEEKITNEEINIKTEDLGKELKSEKEENKEKEDINKEVTQKQEVQENQKIDEKIDEKNEQETIKQTTSDADKIEKTEHIIYGTEDFAMKDSNGKLRNKFDINKEDEMNKLFGFYAQMNVDYYNKKNKTADEIKLRRNVNAQFKRIVDKKSRTLMENDNQTESNFEQKIKEINEGKLFSVNEIDEIAKSNGATIKLFQIFASGVYEKDGIRTRLMQKQRFALANVLQKVSERKLDIESAKTTVKGNNIDSVENKKGNEKGE